MIQKNIRFGLSAIKNIGEAAIRSILGGRKAESFNSLDDFLRKVDLGPVNKKTIESLIKAGAMDSFGNRANMLISYPQLLESLHKKIKQEQEGQGSLFGDTLDNKTQIKKMSENVDDFSTKEKLVFEKEFLGLYLTSHPQIDNLLALKSLITHGLELLAEEKEGTRVKIGGIVETTRRIFTKKNGSEMAFITISDEKGLSVECVVFPRIFDQYKRLLIKDSVVIVNGFIDTKNDKPTIIAQQISSGNSSS